MAVLVVAVLGRGEVTVSPPVLVGDLGVVTVNNSPSIARNPLNPANVVVANRVDRPGFSAAVSASTDGGRTWTTVPPPLPDGLDRPYAPSVAFGPDGTLHLLYVNLTGRGNVPEQLWVARSDTGGRTFEDPVRITGAHPFQARLVVDPATGTIHVTWLQAEELALLAFPGRPVVVASRSTDGGATWSEPVQVSDQDRERVGAAVPVLTEDGDLVVVHKDFRGDRRDFENLEGPAWDQPFALVAVRSEDDGRTFGPTVEIDDHLLPLRRFLPFLPEFPDVVATGGAGLQVVWADGRNGDLDVFTSTSPDAGRTWSAPVRVNDNPLGDGTSQYLPAIDVALSGRVDIAYLDRRDDPTDVRTHASLALGGGRTVVLSPRAFDARIGPAAAPHLEPDFGSRLALDSTGEEVLAAWPDTTLGTQTTGRQDLATRRVRVAPPVLAPWLALTLAGALLAVGCTALWWPRRERGT